VDCWRDVVLVLLLVFGILAFVVVRNRNAVVVEVFTKNCKPTIHKRVSTEMFIMEKE
jgi:hypothetical protein